MYLEHRTGDWPDSRLGSHHPIVGNKVMRWLRQEKKRSRTELWGTNSYLRGEVRMRCQWDSLRVSREGNPGEGGPGPLGESLGMNVLSKVSNAWRGRGENWRYPFYSITSIPAKSNSRVGVGECIGSQNEWKVKKWNLGVGATFFKLVEDREETRDKAVSGRQLFRKW